MRIGFCFCHSRRPTEGDVGGPIEGNFGLSIEDLSSMAGGGDSVTIGCSS